MRNKKQTVYEKTKDTQPREIKCLTWLLFVNNSYSYTLKSLQITPENVSIYKNNL